MLYMGNKVTTTDRLLDPMGLKPSIYELKPNQAERETRYPYDRTYQNVPVNMALSEQREQMAAETIMRSQRGLGGGDGFPVAPGQVQHRYMAGQRPPAPCRQAWTSGRTFRHFRRRADFPDANGRPTQRDYSVGDKYYRPKTIERERVNAARTFQRYYEKGTPSRGQW